MSIPISSPPSAPTFILIFGPQAVGKMTVGLELARRTGYRMMHNHQTIDLLLPLFPFGSPPFVRLLGEFRQRIFDEVAASDLPGFIYTCVWDFASEGDQRAVERHCAPFRARGSRVLFVELEASLETRLARNRTPLRLEHKPSKRDIAASEERLRRSPWQQFNSYGRFPYPTEHLHLVNDDLAPEIAAERIVARLAAAPTA